MGQPVVEILGVYRLSVTEELFQEQYSLLYGYDPTHPERAATERQIRQQLESVVLIEARVRNRDTRYDIRDFVQPRDDVPPENWQAPWAEAYLSHDGNSLAVDRWSKPPESEDLRVAFFLHYWDPILPLRSSYGNLKYPPTQAMPERLARIVPFEPVD